MSIAAIPGVQFIPSSHRCHHHLLDFVVATAAIGSYFTAYHGKQVTTFAPHNQNGAPQYPVTSFAGKASGRNVDFVPDDLLRSVFLQGNRAEPIPYLVRSSFSQIQGSSSSAMAETIEGLAQAMFTGYWESNLSLIVQVHGKRNKGHWPAVLRFAAVVRDAMSHGGIIRMFSSVAPATHFGLTYSPAANGRRIIHNDLACADLFFLMLDVDASF